MTEDKVKKEKYEQTLAEYNRVKKELFLNICGMVKETVKNIFKLIIVLPILTILSPFLFFIETSMFLEKDGLPTDTKSNS